MKAKEDFYKDLDEVEDNEMAENDNDRDQGDNVLGEDSLQNIMLDD